MTQQYPQTTTPLFLQPDGTYLVVSSGVAGEALVLVPVTDLVCVDDVDQDGDETTSDLQVLAQDCYHILLESFGSNPDDPNRGIGVRGLLNGTSTNLVRAASILDSQLRKDDRIDTSQTTITMSVDGTYTLNCEIVANGQLLPLLYTYSQSQGLQVAQ